MEKRKKRKVNYSEYTATPRYVTIGTKTAKGKHQDNSQEETKKEERKLGNYTDGLKKAATSIEIQE